MSTPMNVETPRRIRARAAFLYRDLIGIDYSFLEDVPEFIRI
jgi:hypothetical protein